MSKEWDEIVEEDQANRMDRSINERIYYWKEIARKFFDEAEASHLALKTIVEAIQERDKKL